jgi:hypothetical protein
MAGARAYRGQRDWLDSLTVSTTDIRNDISEVARQRLNQQVQQFLLQGFRPELGVAGGIAKGRWIVCGWSETNSARRWSDVRRHHAWTFDELPGNSFIRRRHGRPSPPLNVSSKKPRALPQAW